MSYRVVEVDEAETFCGDCRAGLRAVLRVKYFRDVGWRFPADADVEECPDDDADHVVEEAAAGDADDDFVFPVIRLLEIFFVAPAVDDLIPPDAFNLDKVDRPHRIAAMLKDLRIGVHEAREIMRAGKVACCLAHSVDVDRIGEAVAVEPLQGVRDARVIDVVFVGFPMRGVAGMEVRWHLARLHDANVFGEIAV